MCFVCMSGFPRCVYGRRFLLLFLALAPGLLRFGFSDNGGFSESNTMIASGSSSSIVVVEENEDVTEETTGVLAAASERSRRAEVRQRMQMEDEDSKEREKLAKAAYKVDRHVCHGSYGPDKCSSSITMMRRRLYTICRIRIKPQKAREAQKKKEKALKEKEEKGGKENEEVSEPHAGGAGPSNPPRIGHELGGRLGAAAEAAAQRRRRTKRAANEKGA